MATIHTHAPKSTIDKINIILITVSIMTLAGFVSEGFYTYHQSTTLPFNINVIIDSVDTSAFCEPYGSTTPSSVPITTSYMSNQGWICNTCNMTISLAPLSSNIDIKSGYKSPSPVSLEVGMNYVQMFANVQQDDDDSSSGELENLMMTNVVMPHESCIIKFGPPQVGTNKWGINGSLVAVCVVVFMATSLVLIFSFVQWYLEWRRGEQYQTV